PPFGLCPSAYRRRNIRRRIVRRMESAGIHEFPHYRDLVRRDPTEREALRSLLVVTISRFFRNKTVFQVLSREVLPQLAAKGTPAAIWSAGCAAGEEAYSLRKMDLLREGSPGRFGLILCRNPAFTYLGPAQRLSVAAMLGASLEEGGYLVLGRTETLPKKTADLFEPAFPAGKIYRLRAIRSLGQISRIGQLVTRGFRQ
ncbi:MAG: CheR family methyltransferase, partial [Candidatus Deferrimicrobiaceae bacterium]